MYNMKDLVFILLGRKIYEKYIYFIVFFKLHTKQCKITNIVCKWQLLSVIKYVAHYINNL